MPLTNPTAARMRVAAIRVPGAMIRRMSPASPFLANALYNDDHFRSVLRHADVDRDRASILLTHAPDRLQIAEEEGFSLQLSGHTHGGQFFPFTWITSHIYGKFVYGLQRLGNLLVYVSYGAGTWGPPLRLGTTPEIVLIQFD